MRRHIPLLLLLIALLLFSLLACDTKPGEVDIGGGDVVMNPGTSTTTRNSGSASGQQPNRPDQPDQPSEGGGIDLPYLPA